MKTGFKAITRNRVVLSLLFVLGLSAVLIFLPSQFRSKAGNDKNSQQNITDRTAARETGIENYDIRLDKFKGDALRGFRQSGGKDAVAIADARDRFVAGEEALRQRVPTLKVEYNQDIRIPEVIAPDVDRGRVFLTGASSLQRSGILRNFIRENNQLIGVNNSQINQLTVRADYTNPDGNLSYAHLEQIINGIPVFRGEIKAGFNSNGEMFRVINNLAPGLDYNNLSTDFNNPLDAVRAAAATLNHELKPADLILNQKDSTDLKAVFGEGSWPTTAEKMYFPTEPGVARAAWRVLIWQPVNAYYVIVDAETGTMLWRKNITHDQTQPATYNVYASSTNLMKTLNNPAPIVPALNSPTPGTQGAVVPRSNITLIGNEAPNTFNDLGWITDNTNGVNGETQGNNTIAGLDVVAPNGIEAPTAGTNRVFNFTYNPGPGNPPPGESPTLPAYRNGAVTQLFYTTNRYHDELYKFGFTEAARNFQNNNFGRGGVGNDRVLGEAQDFSGTNNANFATPADGSSGRMQMYVFTGPNPDYDGDLDAEIVIHELTHGTSNRLIGNGSGLTGNRGGSMGEGWGDFYGLCLLSNPTDPIAANYASGAYATYLLTAAYTYNYYYGIRRFPYAIRSYTGGPLNRPHNPLTFADIDPAQYNVSDGAFPGNPVFVGNGATEVHNAGEVWAVALWEVRAQFATRLGTAVGTAKTLQLVTDGMKLTPNAPNFIQARDAIIAAAAASAFAPDAAADVTDVREGFRIRGMGFGAQDNSPAVVESFAFPNVALADPFTVSDAPGNNNGFPEPGENVLLGISITNTTGATINNVVVNVNGGTPVAYGNLADGATVTRQIPFTIPATATCGSLFSVTINITSDAGTQSQTRSFRLGVPAFGSPTQNFDGVTPPALPVGWTSTNSGSNTGWVTTTVNAVSPPNSVFSPDPGTDGDATLETSATITSATAQLSFSNRYSTEVGFDGTVLDIKVGNGAFQDILAAGGSFVSGGYTGTLFGNTVLGPRQAWTGTPTPNPVNTVINLPASANGQTIVLRWRTASDESQGGLGTWYDNMQLTGGNFLSGYTCGGGAPTPTPTPVASPTPTPVATPTPGGTPTPSPTPGNVCTPSTTVSEGDLFPGGIPSFGVSSGPGSVTIDHVNAGTGTQAIMVVAAPNNAVVNIPAFTPGTFNPVVVTFTVPNPALPTDFVLRAASTFHAAFIRVRCSGMTPTPTPVASPTPTPTPVASPTPTPVASPTPTPGMCPAFSNTTPIVIPGTGTAAGPAAPYPSNITAAGLTGTVTKVTVTLNNLNHTFPDDIDVLLVGPGGQSVILMSDAGLSGDLVNVNLTFDDAAAAMLPDSTQIVSGTYQPTNFEAGDTFPAPAPAGPYGATLSVFNGSAPNGTYSLYVFDDAAIDVGSMSGGWTLNVTTTGCGGPTPTPTPVASPTPTPSGTPGVQQIAYSTTLRFPAAGVTENNLISYSLSAPGTILSDVPVGGLNTGISEYLASIDFRPATGVLYGLVVQNDGAASGTIRLVTVNTTTGNTTPVGVPITVTQPGNFSGFDFNPVPDRIRVIRVLSGARDENFRMNPNDGTLTADTPLAYAAGDPNAGLDEFITAAAYTNSFAGATSTTLYDIDTTRDQLVRQGGNPGNGTPGDPGNPNSGQLFTIGGLGVNTSGLTGFDITTDNRAFAVLDTSLGTGGFGGSGNLYTVNLGTGAATLVGRVGGLTTRFTSSFSIAPAGGTPESDADARSIANPDAGRKPDADPVSNADAVPDTGWLPDAYYPVVIANYNSADYGQL